MMAKWSTMIYMINSTRYDTTGYHQIWYAIVFMMQSNLIWHNVMNIVWYDMEWYDMMWYDMIWFNVM